MLRQRAAALDPVWQGGRGRLTISDLRAVGPDSVDLGLRGVIWLKCPRAVSAEGGRRVYSIRDGDRELVGAR